MEGLSRENIRIGTEFGNFWPEKITDIMMVGGNAFLVQTEDVKISTLQHLVVLRKSDDSLFRSFIKCPSSSLDEAIKWFNACNKEQ